MDASGLETFQLICLDLCQSEDGVCEGKMMSSAGLKYNNKVFAFYHKGEMGFRMGPQFNPEQFGLKFVKPLSPFKTKPPLKGWYMVEAIEKNLWKDLSAMALAFTKTLK